jgi:hypothetical protein
MGCWIKRGLGSSDLSIPLRVSDLIQAVDLRSNDQRRSGRDPHRN